MLAVITALTPIFAIIVAGFVLRSRALIAEEFWLPCEKLNYFYLFPALMYSQIASANFSGISLESMAAALLGAVLLGAVCLYVWRYLRPLPGPTFSSVLQGALRPNTYVGVAAATALYGQEGLTATALAIAITIPILNVCSIVVLALYGGRGPVDKRGLFKSVVSNPVIVSVIAGGLTNLVGISLPDAVASTLKIMGSASLPLGLLAVGAGLDLTAARVSFVPVLQSSIVKLAFVPCATYFIGKSINLHDVPLNAAVMFNALPCTPSAYIMARLLGGDHRMSAGIISVQTSLAAITMPLVLFAIT
jgi:malonate transporter and related proteins